MMRLASVLCYLVMVAGMLVVAVNAFNLNFLGVMVGCVLVIGFGVVASVFGDMSRR